MLDELELIKQVRPPSTAPGDEARARARQALDQAIAGAAPRRRGARRPRFLSPGTLALATSVLVVAAVVGVFLGLRHHSTSSGSRRVSGRLALVFQVRPGPGYPSITPSLMLRVGTLLHDRLWDSLAGASVRVGGRTLTVTFPPGVGATVSRVRVALERQDLLFYDWEQNVLTPSAAAVASRLPSRDPDALKLSQGTSQSAAGSPGAGAMPLYSAVRLASRQPPWVDPANSRQGPEYFMFARPETSPACIAADRAHTIRGGPISSTCYIAGPAPSIQDLDRSVPAGINPSAKGIGTLMVPQGWVVVAATEQGFNPPEPWPPPWPDPTGRYFVLRDRVSLSSSDIVHPRPSTDPAGDQAISFGFTAQGSRAFLNLTAGVARRGAAVGSSTRPLFQHFAVVLGGRLLTLPFVDYRQDPFGIPGNRGAEIVGGFTRKTALHIIAGIDQLPPLRLISVNGHRQG